MDANEEQTMPIAEIVVTLGLVILQAAVIAPMFS
jgi:hypothetical protein